MSQRPEDLATGYVRAAGLLALLIAIVVMHVFIAAHASAGPSEHPAAQTVTNSSAPPAPAVDHPSMPMPGGRMDPGCADGCCVMRGGMHACVFILTALVLILGLALLGRVGSDADAAARLGRGRVIRHARPPPWTMPSLSELSILRI